MKSLKSTSHHLEFGNWGEREERRERGKEREWITSINYYVHGGKSSGPKSKIREISWNGHMRGKPISQKCRFVNQLLSTFMFKCHQVISQKPSLHGSQLLPLYSFPLVHILKLVGQSRRKYPKKKKSQTQTKQTICLSILGTWLDLSGSFHLKLCFRWCVGDSAHQHLRGEEQVPPFPSEF